MTDLAGPMELTQSRADVWQRKPIRWGDVALFLLFCVFTFIWMLPALWSLITSFREEADIQRQLITLTPTALTLELLRADPRRRTGRSMVRQQHRGGRHSHHRPDSSSARWRPLRSLVFRSGASGRFTCSRSSE